MKKDRLACIWHIRCNIRRIFLKSSIQSFQSTYIFFINFLYIYKILEKNSARMLIFYFCINIFMMTSKTYYFSTYVITTFMVVKDVIFQFLYRYGIYMLCTNLQTFRVQGMVVLSSLWNLEPKAFECQWFHFTAHFSMHCQ